MGDRLAVAAFDTAARHDLDGRATRVLVRMTLSAKDTDPQPVYWAGWEPLAVALGYDIPTGDDEESQARRRVLQEFVRRAVAPLTLAGILTVAKRAAPVRNTRYDIHLGIAADEATPHLHGGPSEDATPHPERGASEDERPTFTVADAPPSRSQTPHPQGGADTHDPQVSPPTGGDELLMALLEDAARARSWPITASEVMDYCRRAGHGDARAGWRHLDPVTNEVLTGARNPAALFRHRLRAAVDQAPADEPPPPPCAHRRVEMTGYCSTCGAKVRQ